ncbi:MAG: phenylalanine--tRNA ligase subunit beta [Fimbriimonadales bacterium]
MKITVEWLKEFVETDASPAQIGDELTMLGLELEAIEDSALGPVLDFKVTPNRGDCLSVFGLARELAAKNSQRYRPTSLFIRAAAGFPSASTDGPVTTTDGPVTTTDGPVTTTDRSVTTTDGPVTTTDRSVMTTDGPVTTTDDSRRVTIEAPELCGRYVGAVMRGVKVGSSPSKIAQRLTACGMRPIDSIVDTTNYVMLELGQPLHAFDMRRLKGGRIVVRTAKTGEKMKTLDGVERALTPEMLMICDVERPVAIAGVMGGENSEVARDTTELLLESAHFDPVSVRRTRRSLGMSTEASYRFERFVDPELCLAAARRVAELLGSSLELSDVFPGTVARAVVLVREARWNALLGMEIPVAGAAAILTGLGCSVSQAEGGLSVVPPSWRSDLQIEEDLVEEIGRMWGYEKIPEALPYGASVSAGYGAEAAFRKRVKAAMLRLGFVETLTHSLCAPSSLSVGEGVVIRHAASPELSTLRTSLLPGIAEVAAKNRGQSLALFELGRVFGDGSERRSLGLLVSGEVFAAHWSGGKAAAHDFYSLKGVIEELGGLIRRSLSWQATDDARFHPGRRAAVVLGGARIGVIGEIAPAVCEALDLAPATLAAEIDVDALLASEEEVPTYRPLSHFPAIRRDFAVVMPLGVQYGQIQAALSAAAGGLAERIWLFDVYSGKGIDAGHQSIGVGVMLRHADRTLTDEEANAFTERGFSALEALGGKRRA